MASKVIVGQSSKVQRNGFRAPEQETARIALRPLYEFLKARARHTLFGPGTIATCLKVINHNGHKFTN